MSGFVPRDASIYRARRAVDHSSTHLQSRQLRAGAQDAEGEGVLGPQPREHVAAVQQDGGQAGPGVPSVLVEVQGAPAHAAPLLPPRLVHQDQQGAWGRGEAHVRTRGEIQEETEVI